VQESSCGDVLHYIGTVASLEVVTEIWIIPSPQLLPILRELVELVISTVK